MPVSQFDGVVAVVTGGASGLGQGVVEVLASGGATVWIADCNFQRAKEVAAEFSAYDLSVRAIAVDVADAASVDEAFSKVEEKSGVVTHLVNGAGVNARICALEVDAFNWQRILDVNLTGSFYCAQRLAKRLKESEQSGAIVNITSMLAHIGASNLVSYASSKGGVAMLTRCLATEWASLGIRVNAVSPGYIDTAMTRQMLSLEAYSGSILQRTPLKRFGTPSDVGKAIAFLLSDAASFITGQILAVDGGITGGDPNISPPSDKDIAALLGLA